jgi:hypothetical protein
MQPKPAVGLWLAGNAATVSGFLGDGVHSISVTPPLDSVVRQTFARFRISSKGGLTPAGLAADGEVEDYLVTIQEPEIDQFPNALVNVGIQWLTGPTEPVSLVGSTGWAVFIPPNGQAADLADLELVAFRAREFISLNEREPEKQTD